MHDTAKTWANVLKALRENGHFALMGACADLRDTRFTEDLIIITAQNISVYNTLTRNLDLLNKYAGAAVTIKVYPPRSTKETEANTQTIEKLKNIFGEKLKVEVN